MNRRLIFVWREEHVDFVQTQANPADLIVSLDLDISAMLREFGIAYSEATDFIDADTTRLLLETAPQIAKTWYQPFEADCQIDDVSPLHIEALSLAAYITDGLIAKHLFNEITRRHPIELVLLFEHPTEHIVITENSGKVDLWPSVWRVMAEARQIAVEIIPMPRDPTVVPTRNQKISRMVSSIRAMVANWVAWQRLFLQSARRPEKTACFVVMINEAWRYAQLYDEIAQSFAGERIIPAVIGARRVGGIQFEEFPWMYRALGLLPNLRYFRVRSAARRWYARFLQFQDSYSGEHPELFANPHLAAQFRAYYLNFLPNSQAVFNDARTIFHRTNTRVVIASTFPELHAASVHAAAHNLGITVLALPHSGSPTDKHLRLRGDQTLVWSKDHERAWRSTQGEIPLIVTGLHPSVISQGYEQSRTWKPSESPRKRVTLLLATIQTGMRQWVDMRQHYAALKQLVQMPPHLQDRVELVFKLHPKHDYRHLYQSLVPQSTDHIKIIQDVSLEMVLQETDLAVLVNMSTSAYLLAVAQGIPLLFINTIPDSIIDEYLAVSAWGGKMTVRNQEAIWDTLEQALFDEEARNALLAANRDYWNRMEAAKHDPVETIHAILMGYL